MVAAAMPYIKVKALGAGAFGKVFIVKDAVDGQQLVMKEVCLRGLCPKEQRRSLAEVKILRKLEHPHIVEYKDSALRTADNTLCIVMQLCDGGDLAQRIAACQATKKKFSERSVLRVAAQAVSALAYCHHKLFLLHRDIKPANLFLSRHGDVKIGDFGLSKSLAASHGLANTKCGSPVYMSPELASGRAYDRGCDVWALGATLVEMASLRTPWVDQHQPRTGIIGLMRLISNGSLDLTPLKYSYSAGAMELLSSMLAKPAASRPSFRHLSQHALLRPHITEEASCSVPSQLAGCGDGEGNAKLAPKAASAASPFAGRDPNPFVLGGPLARVATPSSTPRCAPSAPTGGTAQSDLAGPVPIPGPVPFKRGPQRARVEGPPVEAHAHGAEAHVAALAIQRSVRVARAKRGRAQTSPRTIILGVDAASEHWQGKYAQLVAKRKQAAGQVGMGGNVNDNVPGQTAFQERMVQQHQRWALAQGR